jgi:hypothetical protein
MSRLVGAEWDGLKREGIRRMAGGGDVGKLERRGLRGRGEEWRVKEAAKKGYRGKRGKGKERNIAQC